MKHLEAALSKIEDGVLLDRLADMVPPVGVMRHNLTACIQVMHMVVAALQKHQITILTDDDGITADGYDPQEAIAELEGVFHQLQDVSIKFQVR